MADTNDMTHRNADNEDPRTNGWVWILCGVTLLGCCAAATWMSQRFVYGSDMLGRPILPFVGLMIFAALVYFVAVYLATGTTPTRRLTYWVFAVGAGMRLLMVPSLPILEDDYHRYLWDGAVTAHGYNPYAVIPEKAQSRSENVPAALLELGEEGGLILQRVNHPQLGTIYPPVAQAAFALAHAIAPWRLSGLRVLYYGLDCIAFALLILLLKALGRSPLFALIYWWNPLAVKEIYNGVHMDILLVPLLLGAVLLALRGRVVSSMVPLALAVATKLWPVLLVPPILATCIRSPRRAVGAMALFTLLTVFLLSPLIAIVALGKDSGFVAYGTRWEMNDALFMIFPWSIKRIAGLLGWELEGGTAHRGGKLIIMAILATVVLWASWRTFRAEGYSGRSLGAWPEEKKTRWCNGLLWIVATLFLLSPTQFPWYYLWVLPLLALTPNRALLGLTAMLPLYYLRFYYNAHGEVDFFHYRIVWIEYAPIWGLLLFDAWKSWREKENRQGNVAQPSRL